jgi:hypothetical protein
MAEKKEEKKAVVVADKKPKISQTDKYYKIKADFGYLASYNYKITKEIGRGGYGVVYKVSPSRLRRSTSTAAATRSTRSRSTSTRCRASSSTPRWRSCCW